VTKPAPSRKKLGIVKTPHPDLLQQYRVGFLSRQASLLGRKEVLSGKAKFGIFGDGKEVAQLAMANAFRKGDWRSGYYRDQTFMFAIESLTVREFFAQLYADTNLENEPNSGGRQMNSHFATRYLDQRGEWLNQCLMYNSSADLSPTAAQMGRSLGLAYASKLYRQNKNLESLSQFSVNGQEVSFVTIGNASTSEGIFWETINAAGVLQVPLVVSVWDDDYGISVPAKYQTTKENISTLLKGFASDGKLPGVDVYTVKGWDYQALVETYTRAVERSRHDHVPCVVHVTEMTQPQGHSTSGSHERYRIGQRYGVRACCRRTRSSLTRRTREVAGMAGLEPANGHASR
jgi:TPP-dependent pyruvate/acetoin dehydrogenase alpha subunit